MHIIHAWNKIYGIEYISFICIQINEMQISEMKMHQFHQNKARRRKSCFPFVSAQGNKILNILGGLSI